MVIELKDYNRTCERLSKLEGIEFHAHIWEASNLQPAGDSYDKKCKTCGVEIRVEVSTWWRFWE